MNSLKPWVDEFNRVACDDIDINDLEDFEKAEAVMRERMK